VPARRRRRLRGDELDRRDAGGSSGEAKSATVSNLTVAAVATPAAGNLLYRAATATSCSRSRTRTRSRHRHGREPADQLGVRGRVHDKWPVERTAGLLVCQSDVIWNYSSATSGSAHALTTRSPSRPPANRVTLYVTLTNDASMTAASPAACENTYFSMPSLAGIAASGGAGCYGEPATDAWTN